MSKTAGGSKKRGESKENIVPREKSTQKKGGEEERGKKTWKNPKQ